MSSQTRVTLTAGMATLLGAIPLAGGFAQQRWFWYAAMAVAVVSLIGVALRVLRVPALLIVPIQFAGLLVFHTVTFASSDGYGGIIPNGRTISDLSTSISDGMHDIQYLAAPVPARTDIVVLTSLAVGLLAIVVDLIAVSAHRPAVAGLALLALFAVATAVSARTLFFEFAGAGAGYLLLLAVEGRERLVRWGRVVTADDQAGHPGTDRAVVRTPRHGTAGRVGVAAVAVALIVPMLVPGFTRNVLGNLGQGSSTGVSGQQTLGSSLNPFASLKGSLAQSNTYGVLTVKSNSDPWYLRVTVLDEYTPDGWRRGNSREASTAVGSSMQVPTDVTNLKDEGHTREVDATVRVTAYRDNRLPVYYAPTSVTGAGKHWAYDPNRSEIWTSRGVTDYGQTYHIKAQEPDPTQEQLLAAKQLPASNPVMRRWGAQPAVTSKVRQITQQVISGDKSPWERADALNNYFTDDTHGFTYSLQTKAGSSEDALQNFLEQKQGYCEQYASAMAVMLRLAGIPSRVVLGYAQGTYDSKSKTYTITNHDAHAWVEGYFDNIGWVEFDPTPRDDGHTSPPAYQQQPTATAPVLPSAGSTTHSATTGPSVPHSTQSTDPAAGGPTTTGGGSGGSTTPAVAGAVAAGLAALALLLVPALTRRSVRRRRYALARGPDPAAAAHACWSELLATLADLGIPSVPAESPRGTASRLARQRSLDQVATSGLSIIALAEERARYAPEAGVDADLPTALRAARTGLLAGVSRWRRYWIAFAPRSIVLSVMASLSAGSARVSAAISGLGRVLRPRGAHH
jgi:transglutaminase-like putative cysteine protease